MNTIISLPIQHRKKSESVDLKLAFFNWFQFLLLFQPTNGKIPPKRGSSPRKIP
jgi:hypothetical protein